MEKDLDSQVRVLDFLGKREAYSTVAPGEQESPKHLHTHISHVFLFGEYAFKLKRSVKFDFVDFSTLERRRHFCEEEVRLNSRYSEDLYLGVLAVVKRGGELRLSSLGELGAEDVILEYLVQMRRFEESQLFQNLVVKRQLSDAQVEEAGKIIARFHRTAPLTPGFGSLPLLRDTLNEVFSVVENFSPELVGGAPVEKESFLRLATATRAELERIAPVLERRASSHVKAVHGDLHLRNICAFRGRVHLFDGLEFNPGLANGDTWSDLAFLLMDLEFHQLESQADLLCNVYLEETDDFEGLQILPFFLSYRAAVRAKINYLSYPHADSEAERARLCSEAEQYLSLALKELAPQPRPKVFAFGGLSGSGKSTLARAFARQIGAVQIKADAVRKHIFGVSLREKAPPDAYSSEMNERTFRGVLARAKLAIEAGRSVVFDAVFRNPLYRKLLEEEILSAGYEFHGTWCEVSEAVARARIQARVGDISDADEEIFTKQLTDDMGEIRWKRFSTAESVDLLVAKFLKSLSN